MRDGSISAQTPIGPNAMPFDHLPAQNVVRTTVWRPILAIAVFGGLLTLAAVLWRPPFAGTVALLVVFGGLALLAPRLVRRAFRR
jgi:hypothetical protein